MSPQILSLSRLSLSRLSRIGVALFAILSSASAVELLAAGGTIEGKVVFDGRPRRNPLISMGADPNCLSINAGKKVVQELVALHPDKSVGNVLVHLTGDIPYSGAAPSEALTIVQEGCTYHPRVAAAMTGQTLAVRNKDSTLHNIHTQSDAGNSFNVGQPKAGMEYEHKLRGEEILRLKCDVHPWMTGFVGVKSHPYFAVTGDGGTFKIEGVPAGSYTIEAWQERLGVVEQTVEVKDGETTTVDFTYGAGGGQQSSALPVRELVVRAAEE